MVEREPDHNDSYLAHLWYLVKGGLSGANVLAATAMLREGINDLLALFKSEEVERAKRLRDQHIAANKERNDVLQKEYIEGLLKILSRNETLIKSKLQPGYSSNYISLTEKLQLGEIKTDLMISHHTDGSLYADIYMPNQVESGPIKGQHLASCCKRPIAELLLLIEQAIIAYINEDDISSQ